LLCFYPMNIHPFIQLINWDDFLASFQLKVVWLTFLVDPGRSIKHTINNFLWDTIIHLKATGLLWTIPSYNIFSSQASGWYTDLYILLCILLKKTLVKKYSSLRL
jgi:hypothetical protein